MSIVGSILGRQRDSQGRHRRGGYIGTYHGGTFWPLDPRADEVTYDDVVIGMSREGRYANQTREPYTILTHSLLVSVYAEMFALERGWSQSNARLIAAEGLVHDGAEAYVRDMPAPIKYMPAMRGYRKIEKRVQDAVFEHFGVATHEWSTEIVHEVDLRLRVDEVEALMIDPSVYLRHGHGVEGLGAEIPTWSPEQAVAAFGQRFVELFPKYLGTRTL